MSLVIRYRCHGCGAFHDGSGGSAWVRCGYCRTLIGFDYQAWFESPDYAAWLKRSATLAPGFADYQQDVDAAARAVRKGKRDEAEAHLRNAVALLMTLTAHSYPPELQTDPAYRERYLRFEAWGRLCMLTDARLVALDAELQKVCRALDYRDPVPTLEKATAILREELARLAQLPGAEDPDGMPPEARGRVVLSVFVSAYLSMLTAAQRVQALRAVHGASNVVEAGGSSTDEVSFYLDWSCPRCGLASLQGRGAVELCCPGCMHRRPFSSAALGLAALALKCGSCGDAVALGAGAMDARCDACGTTVRRVARTGAAEQSFTREVMASLGSPGLSEEGVEGLPITQENRAQLVLTGLARQASWYGRVIQLPRYLEVVRRTFPDLTDAQRAERLSRAAELSVSDGGGAEALELLEKARARLLGA